MNHGPLLESNDYLLVYDKIPNYGWSYVIKDKRTSEVLDYYPNYREAKYAFYDKVPPLEIELFGIRKLDKYVIL